MKNKLTTEILCTIGPASRELKIMKSLVKENLNGIRINISHTPPEEAAEILKNIRKASKTVPIILDSQGKETRIGALGAPRHLKPREQVTVTALEMAVLGDLYFSRPEINSFIKKNQIIFLDDNSIQLKVVGKKDKQTLICKVLKGGHVSSPKNIRLLKKVEPKTMLTKRDLEIINLAKKYNYSCLALSYVSSAADIKEARQLVPKNISIMSKIETTKAIRNLDEIIEASDSILVDRNDLGTEVGYEKIPLIQKFIIRKCRKAKKPVYIATHLLETMIAKDKPTRGETNDIVNSVLDGANGLVLSSETAVSENPVKVVKTLKNIIRQGEFVLNKNKDGNLIELIERLESLNYV